MRRGKSGRAVKLDFWKGKRVLVTGDTGFKGAWLCFCLTHAGANVLGLALPPPTQPNAFTAMRCASGITSVTADIRDRSAIEKVVAPFKPEVAFHLAAQSLVRQSYAEPVE